MIGRIRGILVDKKPPEIQVDVGGICYEVQVPMSTLYQLPEVGKELNSAYAFCRARRCSACCMASSKRKTSPCFAP